MNPIKRSIPAAKVFGARALIQFLVGVLFIFSGLVKADDPLGLSYKIQEFFEVWNFHVLDHFTVVFSVVMIQFEIVAGVAVLLGWRMRSFGWLLLLLMIFFTFLTGYAYLSGKVRECGCFGDCIPLTAGESFAKDLVLLVLVLFLFTVRGRIKPLFSTPVCTSLVALSSLLTIAFQWYVLVHLPVVDCLPYKAGNDLLEKRKAPPGAIPDSTVITMVYEKGGKQIEFEADKFPADFDDSYHFVKRYDRVVRKGNAEPAIKDLDLFTGAGTDTTDAVLGEKGFRLMLFWREVDDMHPDWNKAFSLILTLAKGKRMPLYLITSDYDNAMDWVRQQGIGEDVTVLKCDATAIKTAARANPTLYLMKGPIVVKKWSYADLAKALPDLNELPAR
jgi:uncharacterized membrane protein YphA (DoxX/SURF4 family)